MRKYRIETLDPRDDSIINIDTINADLFIVDDACKTVTFFVEEESTMVPVGMYPFPYVLGVRPDFEEGDSK